MKKYAIYLQVIAVSIVVYLLDFIFATKDDTSLLIGFLFWAAIAQGLVALSATADLSQGKWSTEIKPYLQEYYPLLLIFPLVFPAFARHLSAYHWSHQPEGWLSPTFFIVRNIIALLIPFIMAHFYVRLSNKKSEKTNLFAVLYILFFVISQSFMAYDQVMTFDYPWINTLMGPFFFVEALYAGVAFAAVLSGLLKLKHSDRFKKAFNDFVLMTMGFALLWAGLFYSQYLVIWYGNIPEEVSYIDIRMKLPFVEEMGIFAIFTLFVIPFVVFISRKMKSIYPVVVVISLLIFAGLIVERVIYLLPVGHLHLLSVVLPVLVIGVPFGLLMKKQTRSE